MRLGEGEPRTGNCKPRSNIIIFLATVCFRQTQFLNLAVSETVVGPSRKRLGFFGNRKNSRITFCPQVLGYLYFRIETPKLHFTFVSVTSFFS